jgi:hypothetical protein
MVVVAVVAVVLPAFRYWWHWWSGNGGAAGGAAGATGSTGGAGSLTAGSGGGGGGGQNSTVALGGAGGTGGVFTEFTSYQTWTGASYTLVTNSSGRGSGGGGGGGNAATSGPGGGSGRAASTSGYGGGGGGAGGGTGFGGSQLGGDGSQGVIYISWETGSRTLYWSGGTGTWNTTSGADWSLTSGGPVGEPPPDAADNVIFNASSGSGTVTVNGGVCNNCTISSPSVTFNQTGTLTVSGDFSTSGGTTWSQAGTLTVSGDFSTSAGTSWTGTSGTLTVNGDFFTSAGTTWTASGATIEARGDFFTTSAGTTWTGSSGGVTINSLGSATTVTTNGVIFLVGFVVNNGKTVILGDALTCGTFTISSTGGGTLDLNGFDITCRRFEMVGTPSGPRRIFFGTNKIVIAPNAASSFLSFVDSSTNSALFTYTGTSNIEFQTTGASSSTSFSTTSSSTIESNSLNVNVNGTGPFVINSGSYLKDLNFTGYTGTFTPSSATIRFFGSLTLVSGMTLTAGTGTWTFAATSGTQTITSAGKTPYGLTQNGAGGTVSIADDLNLISFYSHSAGTLNLNNYNFTAPSFTSSASNTRVINMGSGTWTISGAGTMWNCFDSTNLTLNANTSTIVLSNTSTTARTFSGGGNTYYNLTIGGATGTSTLSIRGSNTFNTIASTKTVAHTISFDAGSTTTVSDWTVTGTVGNIVTINTSTPGTQATLTKTGGGVISGINYLSIRDSNATPGSTWFAGGNSTNVSNNTGWLFKGFSPTNGNFLFFC